MNKINNTSFKWMLSTVRIISENVLRHYEIKLSRINFSSWLLKLTYSTWSIFLQRVVLNCPYVGAFWLVIAYAQKLCAILFPAKLQQLSIVKSSLGQNNRFWKFWIPWFEMRLQKAAEARDKYVTAVHAQLPSWFNRLFIVNQLSFRLYF